MGETVAECREKIVQTVDFQGADNIWWGDDTGGGGGDTEGV